jgi:predicted metalloprotease with PDZ domain
MREARPLGLSIAVGIDEGGRSDHASFLRKQIPSMHFFSGNHPDYHQPTDDAWKINAEGGEQIAELVFHVAEDLDTQAERPNFIVVKRDRQTPAGGVTTFRVVMGLTPNYAADGQEGMGVDGVSPQGPADLAGLKAGDRITSIGGKKVANVYDYMAATRHNNPGDIVDVEVLRDGKPLTLKVTLSGTR